MKSKNWFVFLFSILYSGEAFCQKEANIWHLGNEQTLDFNFVPPVLRVGGPAGKGSGNMGTHADSAGNLLLYSDGINVWNKEAELLGPLQQVDFYQGEVQIVPHPGKPGVFIVFYKGPSPHRDQYWAIYYATVDLAADNGKGSIITRHQLLHTDSHLSFTITYNPATNSYWLVTDRNDNVTSANTDRIYAYKIDAAGVHPQPVISAPLLIGHAFDYKLSPRGNKLAFSIGHPVGTGLADFNLETGAVTDMAIIDSKAYYLEFSPGADVLYGVRDSSLFQFSLCSDDRTTMFWTKKLLSNTGPLLGHPQLGPDGKIYVPQTGTEHLAVIHQPNRLGAAAAFRLFDLPLGREIGSGELLPQFPTNYLYKPYAGSMVEADAGADKEVCVGEKVRLGSASGGQLAYHWSPSEYLDDVHAATPLFHYPDRTITSVRKFRYILSVTGEYCSMIDTVEVTVLPGPEQPVITGSRSVCPWVEEVTYFAEEKEGLQYQWSVTGGVVVAGDGTPSINVNWGASNPGAKVELTVKNTLGCTRHASLPVRVNVLLQTDTPQGDTAVCVNDPVKIYQVHPTRGSEYAWESRGGEIIAGQGTHRASVRWGGEGLHQVWVQERSVTRDTICFGISDPLLVRVFKDSAAVALQVVTVQEQRMQEVDLLWEYGNFSRLAPALQVQRREGGSPTWVTATEVPATVSRLTDPGLPTHQKYFEYRVQAQNRCGETIYSTMHNTILLEGKAELQAEGISLKWNPYGGWERGVKEYQIWRQLDEEDTFRLIHTTAGNLLHYQANLGRDGFKHRLRVKAVAVGTGLSSWSNEVVLEFEHPLTIPNVFTPNGDGYNDFFFIPKLELYPENELVVFNRWGKEVYRQQGYQGGWNGGSLAPGVYFYLLNLTRGNRQLKGWIELIH